ncbi:MAG: hypothetical protein MI741_18670, partial [Rhodospirillales bacterium]|nr:hypothetical protein [Rhodospirillales bacterium]
MELIRAGLRPVRTKWSGRHWAVDGWTLGAIAVASCLAIPLISLVFLALSPSGGIWNHLASTVLGHYVATTVILMAGVGLGTLAIGT